MLIIEAMAQQRIFVKHISIDPTRNIDSLISITSNGLFVYLGLHAAGFIGIKFRS